MRSSHKDSSNQIIRIASRVYKSSNNVQAQAKPSQAINKVIENRIFGLLHVARSLANICFQSGSIIMISSHSGASWRYALEALDGKLKMKMRLNKFSSKLKRE